MEIVTKEAPAAVSPVEDEHPNGSFEVVLSTETLDRDKEHLWADEWKQPLPEKIHFDGDHGRSLDKTVGSAVPRLEGNKLVAKGTYASTPYAQMVRQLVNEGHINSVSVTFAERKIQKNGDAPVNPTGIQRELLNAAFVAIPANPEAVVLSSKAKKREQDNKPSDEDDRDVDEDDEDKDEDNEPRKRNPKKAFLDVVEQLYGGKAAGGLSASGDNPTVKHDAMVQAIHDAAFHLGAQCMNYSEADPGTDEGANKRGPTGTIKDGLITLNEARKYFTLETSGSKDAGSPQESADEDTAAAAKAAAAVDKSAEDTATVKAKELEKARALAFLISMNTKEH